MSGPSTVTGSQPFVGPQQHVRQPESCQCLKIISTSASCEALSITVYSHDDVVTSATYQDVSIYGQALSNMSWH